MKFRDLKRNQGFVYKNAVCIKCYPFQYQVYVGRVDVCNAFNVLRGIPMTFFEDDEVSVIENFKETLDKFKPT